MEKNTILNIISILLITTLYFLKDLKEWYKVWRKKNFFNQNVELDIKVEEELAIVVAKFGFNRVSIIKYHNGSESFDNFSFNFASMTHEKTDPSTKSIVKEFQRVPLASYAPVLKKLKESKDGVVRVESDSTTPGVMQGGWGIVESWNFMLTDRVADGILCCVSVHDKMELTPEEIAELRSITYKINVYLERQK